MEHNLGPVNKVYKKAKQGGVVYAQEDFSDVFYEEGVLTDLCVSRFRLFFVDFM